MSKKGAHINVLGDRLRLYYEHLMSDAQTFMNEMQKDLEWPLGDRGPSASVAGAGDRVSQVPPSSHPMRK